MFVMFKLYRNCKDRLYILNVQVFNLELRIFNIMFKQKVTKSDLEKMKVGEQKMFTLPSFAKARSAQSYANQMKRLTAGTSNPMQFKSLIGDILDGGACAISITRIA